jgi:hypothetical protein
MYKRIHTIIYNIQCNTKHSVAYIQCIHTTHTYISADMPLAQKKAIAAVRLAAAPTECNTKHGVTYTNRKCQRCGIGVDNEHHMLFECGHVALVANTFRSI